MSLKTKIKGFFRLLHRNYRWNQDAKIWRKKVHKKNLRDIPQGKKVILMPHSDDEWIGCSQLLQNNANEIVVVNMNMAGGDSEQLHILRRREAGAVAYRLGYRFITLQDSPIEALINILQKEKPFVVFLPCYLDWHEEHIEVMKIFRSVANDCGYDGLVGMYQVSLPIPDKMINCGYTMRKRVLKQKWNNLKIYYPSQKFLSTRRFLLNEYINGALLKHMDLKLML